MRAWLVSRPISQGERVMNLSSGRLPGRVPRRFPVGTTYVVEGYGGEQGHLRVISRYVVLPGGHRINVPGGNLSSVPAAAMAARRRDPNLKQSRAKSRLGRAGKKFAVGTGTR
jgi:hypothetical protein